MLLNIFEDGILVEENRYLNDCILPAFKYDLNTGKMCLKKGNTLYVATDVEPVKNVGVKGTVKFSGSEGERIVVEADEAVGILDYLNLEDGDWRGDFPRNAGRTVECRHGLDRGQEPRSRPA